MASDFHARPASPGADTERFLEALADLRASADHLERYATASRKAARTGLSRLRTSAASARELAASVAPPPVPSASRRRSRRDG